VATSTINSSHAILAGQREGFEMPATSAMHDHPIGIPYPIDSREYRPRGAAEAKGVSLPEGRVECVSCHDPHNAAGVESMLIMPNRRSALCLACHIK
jgi:predicted CXXCH cytochrome family protein